MSKETLKLILQVVFANCSDWVKNTITHLIAFGEFPESNVQIGSEIVYNTYVNPDKVKNYKITRRTTNPDSNYHDVVATVIAINPVKQDGVEIRYNYNGHITKDSVGDFKLADHINGNYDLIEPIQQEPDFDALIGDVLDAPSEQV